MQTLHAENFIEFTVLPYIIGGFALLIAITAFVGRKKLLNFSFISFLLFGIIAMVDFWRWEYNYGHNLDPNAAIIVPGMAYQPPLIGYKQLLNFGAFSVPDIGGWLFVGCGLILLVIVLLESGFLKRFKKSSTLLILPISFSFFACTQSGPIPINLNKDYCDYCKMNISDGRFGAEVKTNKGRDYKFDDLSCMLEYIKENRNTPFASIYIHDFSKENVLIPAETAHYVHSSSIRSPMNGQTAAFATEGKANEFAKSVGSFVQSWDLISK
jgi:copper chaperone NosL